MLPRLGATWKLHDGKSVHVAMLVTLRHCIKKCNYVTDRADYIASPSTDHGKLMGGIHELPCRLEPFPEKRKRPEHAGCSGFEVIVGVLHSNQRPSAVCVSLLVYGLSAIPEEFASGFAACSAIPGTWQHCALGFSWALRRNVTLLLQS